MTAVLNFPAKSRLSLNLQDNKQFDWATFILRETNPDRADSEWLHDYRRKNLPNIMRGLDKIQKAHQYGISTFFGMLYMKVIDNINDANSPFRDYGLVSCRLVTDAGVAFIVDAFQNSVEMETMRYHGVGTGTTAEAAGDTALVTESTTALNPDSTRATGTLAEGATGNIYRTVGTNTFDASATITEHGVFSQAATGGGTLLDRSKFTGIGVVSGNSLQSTYDFTLTSGG